MTTDTTDPDSSHRFSTTRRAVLAALGALATAGSAQAETVLGGNPSGSASSEYWYGRYSSAPSTIPPEFDAGAWTQRDTGTLRAGHSSSLPVTFTAGGVAWSLASDIATAESNAPSGPAVAIASDGTINVGYDGSLPQTHSADGVTTAIASTVADAKAKVSAAPAIAAGGDGVEVLIDG